jgi:hypothetical protein
MLRSLQDSAFSAWVLGSDSIWSYPTVLTLHTVGLAILVGAAMVIDLRLLGVGRGVPLASVARLYRLVWVGFVINLGSGIVLFVVQAADRAGQTVFYVKLAFIVVAFALALALKRHLHAADDAPTRGRPLAVISLVCWLGAIVTGRLMAYV